jgi:formylglycine-generating enzyme required for sulfatase activity
MTQVQWARLSGTKPSQFRGGDVSPVDSVTWIEADLWLRRAGMVLPTAFQWEHAARAGTTTPWHTGANRASLEGYANIAGVEFERDDEESSVKHEAWNDKCEPPTAVGRFLPNGFGLYDVHGNVYEWIRERVAVFPRPGDGDSLQVTSQAPFLKSQRGGSYRRDAILAKVSKDIPKAADVRDYESGVRAARNLDP